MEIIVEESSGLNFENFADIQIYRPRYSSKLRIRIESESHFRSKFDTGIYTNPQEINKFLFHQFDFYSKKFNEIIPKLASRALIEFILCEYDKASEIEKKYKLGKLNQQQADRWSKLGSKFRRAAKYLCERVVLLQPEEVPHSPKNSLLELLDEIWIAAEEMVELYLISDQTIMIFPDKSICEIYSREEYDFNKPFFSIDVSQQVNLSEIIKRDTANRSSIIGDSNKFLTNINWHDQNLGNVLKETIGVSFDEAISLLIITIRNSEPVQDSYPILFVHRTNLIQALHKHTKLPIKSIEIVLDGFTLRKKDMETENREIWKSKQKYRAFRRGFFEMPHSTGTHLAFCKSMALESLNQLVTGVVFKKLPPEWSNKSNNKVNKALAKLSNQAGKKFEHIVKENLASINIIGQISINKRVGDRNNFIKIPPEVGEIDFLGYSENENFLLIAECKLVQGGSEGKFFRDDIQEFIKSRKSYLKKFDRKVKWLLNNYSPVINALNSMHIHKVPIQPKKIVTAIITYYPTIAQYFIEDYPCVSVTNLVLDYKNKGQWTYSKGVFTLP